MANAPAYMGQHEVKIATINHPFALRPRRVEIPIPDTCEELHREASDDNAAWKAMTYTPATDSELSASGSQAPTVFQQDAYAARAGMSYGDASAANRSRDSTSICSA